MPPAIVDHGQELTLRTRRGADLVFAVTLQNPPGTPIDITGATIVGRIFAPGQADIPIAGVVDGPAGKLTVTVPATTTKQMAQDWNYALGMSLAGVVKMLTFGAFQVSQDFV